MQATTRTRRQFKRQSLTRGLLWCLLVGFMLLQFLGAAHRYLHASDASSYAPASLFAHEATTHVSSDARTSDKNTTSTCQLFDAACAQLALGTSVVTLPSWALFHAVSGRVSLAVLPHYFWAFEARGSPTLI